MAEYEGFPLALRVRPNANSPANRRAFPDRLVVTHNLDRVKPSGLPESEYNDTLAEFDHTVHQFIERDGEGLVVLVETFAGKRTYYAYVAASTRFKTRLKKLQVKYPQHHLEVAQRPDAEWKLYDYYRELFPW